MSLDDMPEDMSMLGTFYDEECSSIAMQAARQKRPLVEVTPMRKHNMIVMRLLILWAYLARTMQGILVIFSLVYPAKKLEEHKFKNFIVLDILKSKGGGARFWCCTNDIVYDVVESMCKHNVDALVVLKPGEKKIITGIVTQRDYGKKIMFSRKSSISTKVMDIMTEENELITVTSDTKVLHALKLMKDNNIRHIPVVGDTKLIGIVSYDELTCALEREHHMSCGGEQISFQEKKRLSAFYGVVSR